MQNTEVNGNMPWIIFKLCRSNYAVTSDLVAGISELPSEIVPIPSADPAFMGVSVMRGQIIPLLNLRKFFGMPSLEDEYREFVDEMESRKQDHVNWVSEVHRCIESGDEFRLTTDPDACKFGKWLAGFQTERNELKSHLQHIKKPHARLHKLAEEIFSPETDKETKEELLYELESYYKPKVLSLLDEGKEIFASHYKGIVLLVQSKSSEGYMGLVCDDVSSVEGINIVFDEKDLRKLYSSEYISGVAHSERVDGEIVMLDAERLMGLCPSIDELSVK